MTDPKAPSLACLFRLDYEPQALDLGPFLDEAGYLVDCVRHRPRWVVFFGHWTFELQRWTAKLMQSLGRMNPKHLVEIILCHLVVSQQVVRSVQRSEAKEVVRRFASLSFF